MTSLNDSIPEEQLTDEAKAYQKMSEENDMKQHADKIIQGIKSLDGNDANRAIWELFQNAVDLSVEAKIEVRITENEFLFTHNGKPFEPLTLDCLFKQLSSKTLVAKKVEYDESDPLGQYGTGFMTTHTLGKMVYIDGALTYGSWYVKLKDFLLDRSTENWQVMAGRIAELKREVSVMLSSPDRFEPPYPATTFRYQSSSKQNKDNALIAENSLKLILPYVMALNYKVRQVTLIDQSGELLIYEHNGNDIENGIAYASISINKVEKRVYYIKSPDGKVTVLLPLKNRITIEDLPTQLPRLFVQYPLIGSEQLGINFMIHSRHFHPTEPRDTLYLACENDNNEFEEEINKRFLDQASALIYDFVRQYGVGLSDSFLLAQANFPTNSNNEYLNSYFASLKKKWINYFVQLPLVDTASGKLTPAVASFWSEELLTDEEAFDATAYFTAKYYTDSTNSSIAAKWTNVVDKWNVEDIKRISIEDISKHIEVDGSISVVGNKALLLAWCKSLITRGKDGLFTSLKLLPNIKGEFRLLSGLNLPVNLPKEMIAIADSLMPDIPKRHIDPEFKFNFQLTPYLRKNYEAEINQACNVLGDEIRGSALVEDNRLKALIDYCSIVYSLNASNVPLNVVNIIAEFYKLPFLPIVVPTIKDDELDLRTAQKRLLRLCLNDLMMKEKDWIVENMDWIRRIIYAGAKNDVFKDIFSNLAVYPNKLNELCLQSALSMDGGIPDEIIGLYDKIVKPNIELRGMLVNSLFNDYISDQDAFTPRMAAEEIEDILSSDHLYNDIADHEFRDEILYIIKNISENNWGKWFYYLRERRASVMLDTVMNEDSKDSIFAIVTLDAHKLELLGNLAQNTNLEEIVRLGEDAFLRQQQHDGTMKHKKAIGTHIERILHARLQDVMASRIEVDVLNIQDGQDIIIKIDKKPVYFIEVKSRWNKDSSVRMSRNQTINAFKERAQYTLCTVDMSKYEEEDRYKIEDIEKIRAFIHFNDNIGDRVEQFQDALKLPESIDEFHLDGEFRTVVPMQYINTGESLQSFEQKLILKVESILRAVM